MYLTSITIAKCSEIFASETSRKICEIFVQNENVLKCVCLFWELVSPQFEWIINIFKRRSFVRDLFNGPFNCSFIVLHVV